MVRCAVGGVGHADRLQRLDDAGVDLVRRQPEVRRAEGHVLADARHEQLVVGVLEDDADAPAHLLQVLALHRQAVDVHGSGGRQQDAVQVQHEGGLAGAVRPQQGGALAGLQDQVHAVQRLVPVGVAVRHAGQVESRGRRAHATAAERATRPAEAGRTKAVAHWATRVGWRRMTGMVPLKPRDRMARWTRSPRS